VTAINQPYSDEKGHENDQESEHWAEGVQNNPGSLDSTAVFELDKVLFHQLLSRTGNDLLPVLCLLDRFLRGRCHVGSPPRRCHLPTGHSTFAATLSLSLSETGVEEEGASPR
jgi:hypothetical protein